jgi:hypothetical protein
MVWPSSSKVNDELWRCHQYEGKKHRVSAHASFSGAVARLTVSSHKGTTVWNSALWP